MSDPHDLPDLEGRSAPRTIAATPADPAPAATASAIRTPTATATVTPAPFTARADQRPLSDDPDRTDQPDCCDQSSDSPCPPTGTGRSRQQYQGAQNRHNILLVAAVAAASLSLGGYFLLSSKANAITPAAYANQSSRVAGAATPTTAPTTRRPAAEAPFAAAVPQAKVVFEPPSDYASNSLTADPGCVGYNDATNASSAALGDAPTAAAAAAALTGLGTSLQQSAAEAQDPTLAAALTAEAAFVEQDQPILVTALTSGDSDDEVAAYQPIEDTDTYVSVVCGSYVGGDGSAD
jgi:hypothetical protein